MAKSIDSTASPVPPQGFVPLHAFDLEHAKASDFAELVELYEETWTKTPGPGKLDLDDGWHVITPAVAEDLLRRNKKNRRLTFATIVYYAHQMKDGEWPKTGQPLLFSLDEVLLDGQHRLWACLLSGTAFSTYVVANVPDHPQLFAYIDNVKPRAPAAALETAGFNGVSPTIAKMLKIAHEIGGYSVASTGPHDRLTPIEYVRLAEQHVNVQRAARLASSDWAEAGKLVGHKEFVGYVGMRIMDIYDQDTADEFFADLVDVVNPFPSDGAIIKFRKLIADDQKKLKPMVSHMILGHLIKAFNYWKAGADLPKRWQIATSEDFPAFEEPEIIRDAAE